MRSFRVYEDPGEDIQKGGLVAKRLDKKGCGVREKRDALKDIDGNVKKRKGGEAEWGKPVVVESRVVGRLEAGIAGSAVGKKRSGRGDGASWEVWPPIYVNNVIAYLKRVEIEHWPKPGFMSRQPELTFKARSLLVDWLTEVAFDLKLSDAVLWSAVLYCDRFLGKFSVVKSKYQLLGVTSILLAAKYEAVEVPSVVQLIELTENSFSEAQVLGMEKLLLRVLDYKLGPPYPPLFLHTLGVETPSLHLASYILELALVDGGSFFSFAPSVLATASATLARYCLGASVWPDGFAAMSGYSPADLRAAVSLLNSAHSSANERTLVATREKYLESKYSKVANIPHVNLADDYLLHLHSLSSQPFK